MRVVSWMGMIGVLAGCSNDSETKPADDGAEDTPTFHPDIVPIIGENCQQCHNSAQPMGGAFPLETYEQVYAYASVLLKKMSPEGDTQDPFFMPPFNARSTDECAPPHSFRGNYQVSAEEYAVFDAWITAGMEEGDPGASAAFTVPPVPALSGDVYALSFAGEYQVPAPSMGENDSFRCFAMEREDGSVAPPSSVWIDGFEFTPGNPDVAHHMLLFSVPNLAEQMANGLVEDPQTQSWPCDGGVSRSDGAYTVQEFDLMWGWVPGGLPLDLGWDMGMRLEANTGLVVQMHYNTLANPSDLSDRSSLGVRLMEQAPEREAFFELIGVGSAGASDEVDEPPFLVPLGATEHIESYTLSPDAPGVRMWGFIPHMHLAGTALQMRQGGDGGDTCLVNVPRYDYNWQQMYIYESDWSQLPQLQSGDALRVQCTYDNSESNVMLEKYLGGPVTEGVRLGDGTSDEMCLVGVGFACDGLCE